MRRAGAALLGVLLLVPQMACYEVGPAYSLAPRPEVEFTFDLTDAGRVSLASQLGPEVRSVIGQISASSDSVITVSTRSVVYLRGDESPLMNTPVQLRRDHLAMVTQRQFSVSKSLMLAGAIAVAAGAFMASRGLIGTGGSEPTSPPCGPGGCSTTFRP